jgi:hypothetical protein
VPAEARVFDIWGRLSPPILSDSVKSKAIIVCKCGTALNKIFLSGAGLAFSKWHMAGKYEST